MKTDLNNISSGLKLAQIAWVVSDLEASVRFFKQTLGITSFSEIMTIRAKDFEGIYHGKPNDEETLVAMGYSGGTFIELIQPLSGSGMFREYLEKNPAGGLQHIAYSTSIDLFNNAISNFNGQGYDVISSYNTPIGHSSAH